MSSRSASCPNCGAPVEFRWSSSVQTVCEHCRSVLVRTDLDLKNVGQVADLPEDASPIQLLTSGRYGDLAFVVGGRIRYQYDQGSWNEWHLVGGKDAWLSDAQNELAVSFRMDVPQLPPADQVPLGRAFVWNGTRFIVTSRTLAHYAGVEGELPFEYWDKTEVVFIDLRSERQDFATIDYSDDAPALYIGQTVDFDALKLENVRRFEGW